VRRFCGGDARGGATAPVPHPDRRGAKRGVFRKISNDGGRRNRGVQKGVTLAFRRSTMLERPSAEKPKFAAGRLKTNNWRTALAWRDLA
jgi:hypothetical protein